VVQSTSKRAWDQASRGRKQTPEVPEDKTYTNAEDSWEKNMEENIDENQMFVENGPTITLHYILMFVQQKQLIMLAP
jgi:hypothetical protein